MGRSLASGGATLSSSSVPVGQVPRQTRHSSSDERVPGDRQSRSGCIKGRQQAPSADNAARATAEQAFDSLRSRRSSSRQSFGGAPSAVDGPHMNKRAAAAAASGGTSKVPKPSIVQKALTAAANRPAARKRAVRERTPLGGDAGESGSDGSGAQPPAQRRRSARAEAASSGAGPSSPAAASSSLPDELSGDEFDEEAEAAFHDSPNRMEHTAEAFARLPRGCSATLARYGVGPLVVGMSLVVEHFFIIRIFDPSIAVGTHVCARQLRIRCRA